jgi:hypothetical protein
LALGDFNNDGSLDFAVAGLGLTVFLNNGHGAFGSTPLTGTDIFSYVVAADFNGDGKLDLGVYGPTRMGGISLLFLGNGDGTFQAGQNSSF